MVKRKSKVDMRFNLKRRRKPKETLKQRVRKIEKTIENKQVYKYDDNSAADNAWTQVDLLPSLNQGVTDGGTATDINQISARIGNRVSVDHIYFRMTMEGQLLNPGSLTLSPVNETGNRCRIIVVQNTKGVALAIADVLWSAGTGGYALASPLRTNPEAGKKYKLLLDKSFSISVSNPNPMIIKRFKVNKNLLYDDNSTLPSNYNIQCFIFQESMKGSTVLPYTYVSKMTFKDA